MLLFGTSEEWIAKIERGFERAKSSLQIGYISKPLFKSSHHTITISTANHITMPQPLFTSSHHHQPYMPPPLLPTHFPTAGEHSTTTASTTVTTIISSNHNFAASASNTVQSPLSHHTINQSPKYSSKQ